MREPRTATGRRFADRIAHLNIVGDIADIAAIEADERRRFVEEELAGLLAKALEAADKADPDPSRFYSGEVIYGSYEDHAEAVLNTLRAALKEQPRLESGASAVGRIARQGWHRPWCWQQWARSLADSEMGSACTCSAALKEQPR